MALAITADVSASSEIPTDKAFWLGGTLNVQGRLLLDDGTSIQGSGVTFLFRWIADRSVQIELNGVWDAEVGVWRCAAELSQSGPWEVRLQSQSPQRQSDWLEILIAATPGAGVAPQGTVLVTQVGNVLVTQTGGGVTGARISELPVAETATDVSLPGFDINGNDVQVPFVAISDAAGEAAAQSPAVIAAAGQFGATAGALAGAEAAVPVANSAGASAGATAGATAGAAAAAPKVNRAGDAMDGPLSVVAPIADANAVSKGWTEGRLFSIASRAAAVAGSVLIPFAVVTGVTVMGYASAGDGGQATYKLVATEPAHEGKFFNNGRWFELIEREVDPRMFGSVANGSVDDTIPIQRAAAMVQSKSAAVGAQTPLPNQPVLKFGPGIYNAPGLVIDSQATGWSVVCSGLATQLQGIRFRFGGNRQYFGGSPILTGTGSYGIERYNAGARNFIADKPYVKDRDIAFWLTGGNQDEYICPTAEKCGDGMRLDGGGSAQVVLGEFLNGTGIGVDLRKGGEMKFVNCRSLGNALRNLRVYGTNRRASVEHYFTQCTFTVAGRNRIIPILSVADGGAGFARVTFATAVPVTAIAARGARLVMPVIGGSTASGSINIGNNTGGSWDGLLIGGVQVMTSPIAWAGSRTSMATALATQINAAAVIPTLRCEASGTKIYFDDSRGAAAQWTAIEPQISGGLVLLPQAYVAVTTSTPHGYSAEQDVDLRTTQTEHTGIQRIVHVEDATTFCVEDEFKATATGTCTIAHRLQNGMRDVQVVGGPYAGQRVISNVTQTTFDIELAYSAAWAGSATLPNWDVEIYAEENNFRVNDQFFIGGNINYTLIRSGYNIVFKGTRLKLQKWIDPAFKADLKSARIHFDVPTRGRDDNVFADIDVGGAREGWTEHRQANDNGSSYPGGEFESIEAPDVTADLVGNAVVVRNGFRAYGDHLEFRNSSLTHSFTALEGTLYGHGLRSAANAVNTFQLTAGATGARPELKVRSSVDTDVGMSITTQGLGKHEFYGGSNGRVFQGRPTASAVNYPYLQSAADGGGCTLGVDGSSTSSTLRLGGKNAAVTFLNPAQLQSYTVATVPDPAAFIRSLISVSNASTGAAPCYSTGSAWINLRNNAAVA